MKGHPDDETVQTEGIDALVNIADSSKGKRHLLSLGGLALVAAAKELCKTKMGQPLKKIYEMPAPSLDDVERAVAAHHTRPATTPGTG